MSPCRLCLRLIPACVSVPASVLGSTCAVLPSCQLGCQYTGIWMWAAGPWLVACPSASSREAGAQRVLCRVPVRVLHSTH